MKAYTDVKQSKMLAEILPVESADMVLLHEEPYKTSDSMFDGLHQALCVPFSKYDKSWRQKYKNISYFPCWSLAALLKIIPSHLGEFKDNIDFGLSKSFNGKWYSAHYLKTSDNGELSAVYVKTGDTSIDACYEMVLELHKNKLI